MQKPAGAFGNPTSDSRRAMISPGIHRISSVVYSFSGNHEFDLIASQCHELLIAHCRAKETNVKIVS
ncbi:MAG TPA: hypothetical protein DHV55_10120 [Clostridiaceae bacterium]|nr:hypothetical protein [Clostridiaceae bacterium]